MVKEHPCPGGEGGEGGQGPRGEGGQGPRGEAGSREFVIQGFPGAGQGRHLVAR